MKKTKFLSALTLVLMLLLTLSSCGLGAFLENIDFDYKSTPAYTSFTEVTGIKGTVSDYGNSLVYAYQSNNDGNVHSIYNIETGNIIFTNTVTNADNSIQVKIHKFGNKDLYTIKRTINYELESISLFDQNGSLIATTKTETEAKIICNELLVFDNAVYTLSKNGFEKLSELDGNLRNFPNLDYLHISKKYIYNIDGDQITVYTKSGEFKYGYTAPSYAEDVNFFILNNGKIAVQYVKELFEQDDKFDITLNGKKYDLVTQIINPANGKIKNKNVGFLIISIASSYELDLSDITSFKKGFNGNIAAITRIEDDGTINENTFEFVELYNDLKVRASASGILNYATTFEEFKIVRDGVMVIEDNFDNLVFIKKNGKTLATFKDGNIAYSESFIVTDTAIYDYGIKPLYNFKDNGYEFISLADTFVILRKNNEYFKFTSAMTEPQIINSTVTGDIYQEIKLGMYCVQRGNEYAYLDATGKTIAVFSGKITSTYVSENGNTLVRAGGKYYRLSV